MRSKRGLSVPRSLGKRKTSPICGIARFRMPETARRFFHRMAPLVFIRQKFFCIKVALQKGPMLWRLVRKAACVLRRLVGERSAPQNGALFRAENQKAIERQVRPLASTRPQNGENSRRDETHCVCGGTRFACGMKKPRNGNKRPPASTRPQHGENLRHDGTHFVCSRVQRLYRTENFFKAEN